MNSLAFLLPEGIRSAHLLRVSGFAACLLLPSAVFGQLQSNPVDVNQDGVPDLIERYQYFGGGTSSTVEVLKATHSDNELLISPSGDAAFALGASLDGNLKTSSFPSVSSYGYYGFRFRAADGLHYGWFSAGQPHFPGGGFVPNFIGVVVGSHGYNLVPDAPFTVGTPTSAVPIPIPLVLKASVVGGRLRLSWNRDAAPSGVLVESRALRPDASWVFVQTVSSGSQLDVDPGGVGRMYRVVKN
jgi:hypothetical protein